MNGRILIGIAAALLAAAGIAPAQQWEFGGVGGAGFLKGLPVTGPAGAATAGFKSGVAFGGFFGQNLNRRLSGELHYNYLRNDMLLTAGGGEATFKGASHVVHYDLLLHAGHRRSRVYPFGVAGFGMRVFQGSGKEAAYQPLSEHAIFTRTQSVKPLVSVGGGLKFKIAPRIWLRTEFRDYISLFPKEVFTPAPGQKVSGVLHDFVPMVGLSYMF